METLLIIEDEQLLGSELKRHLQQTGWDVVWVGNLSEARDMLEKQALTPLVIVSDLNLPDGNGLDFMAAMKQATGFTAWLFLTGYGSVPDSVRALRLGAFDFLEKPCDLERLDIVLASAARGASFQRRLLEQSEQEHRRYTPDAYVGHSAKAREVRALLGKLTRVPFSTLIIGGETGTGKGLAAKILHYGGARTNQALIEVNCAALPRELLESELFGHESGAFTGAAHRHRGLFEQSDGGTLFMDEIGEMPLELQAKLLKAIENRKFRRLGGEKEITVDVQIIAASHRDLAKMVKHQEFRADLYHRLSVFKIELPPLREALDDLESLTPLFVAEFNAKAGRKVKHIAPDIWQKMKNYHWPGNVRELRNVIERCVLLADDEQLPGQWLQLPDNAALPEQTRRQGVFLPLDGSMALDDMDKHIIETALQRTGGNLTAAARMLGATRETLRYRVKKYRLDAASD